MTKLLEEAIAAVRKLPEQRQDELAEVLRAASETRANAHTKEQRDAIEAGIADADAGRFASDDEVAALFSKYRAA